MAIMALLAVVLTTDAPAQAQAVTPVTVYFDQAIVQNLREGTTNTITVALSEDPGRELTIPITVNYLGEASSDDHSAVPPNVTFEEESYFGETYYADFARFTIEATEDSDDDGESIVLGFGTLPQGVRLGSPSTIRLNITDDGIVTLGLAQVGIAVNATVADYGEDYSLHDVLPEDASWRWQRSATEFGVYSDISSSQGGTSNSYTPSESDLGMWLKAKVTYDRDESTGHTAERTARQPVLPKPLASLAGSTTRNTTAYGSPLNEPVRYAQGFTTGSDTRGYVLRGVRLSLVKDSGEFVEATWAVHADDDGKPAGAPLSVASPILNEDIPTFGGFRNALFEEFTHPEGVPLAADTDYWIVISQTTSLDDGLMSLAALSDWAQQI